MPSRPSPAGPASTGPASRSERALAVLSRQPKILVAVVAVALLIAGLRAPAAIGIPCLLVLAAALAWLAQLSWPVLPPPARAVRVLVVAGVVLLALTRL